MSILVCADDLAAVSRRQSLIDAVGLAVQVVVNADRCSSRQLVINRGFHELIELLMNLTEPSQKAKLAPPG